MDLGDIFSDTGSDKMVLEPKVGFLVMPILGVVGYLMGKFRYDAPPMVLALVLGPMLEEALRQSLILSRGNFSIFISRPISLGFLIIAALLLVIPIITQRRRLSTLKE